MRTLLPATVVAMLASLGALQPDQGILTRLVWFDRSGTRLGGVGPVADHGNLELSPDGTQVAVAVRDSRTGTFDIWIYDVDGGGRRQVTSEPSDENWLIWSPDGSRVLLNSFGPDALRLLEGPVAGPVAAIPAVGSPGGKWPVSWSPDGRTLLVVTNDRRTGNDIWVVPLDGDEAPYPFLRTAESENWAAFSPDGRWVAFSATDSGRIEVYVAPFPATGRRWQVSSDGGSQARWRRDGTEIFYVSSDRMLVAAAVDAAGDAFSVRGFEALFRLQHPYGAYHAFDVTGDGERFLVNTLVVDPDPSSVVARGPAPPPPAGPGRRTPGPRPERGA